MTTKFKKTLICICLFKKWGASQNYSTKTNNFFFFSTLLNLNAL